MLSALAYELELVEGYLALEQVCCVTFLVPVYLFTWGSV